MVQFTRLSPILLTIGYGFSDYIIGGLAQLARALAWHARGSRFKSDHLQKRGSLSLILSHIKSNCKFVKNRLPEYAPSRCEEKAARMPLMYLPKNGDFNYLT